MVHELRALLPNKSLNATPKLRIELPLGHVNCGGRSQTGRALTLCYVSQDFADRVC